MKKILINTTLFSILCSAIGCGGGSSSSTPSTTSTTSDNANTDAVSTTTDCDTELHPAFLDFGENIEVVLDAANCQVTIEATGKPDHSSPYWDPNGANADLYEEPGEETVIERMSPGYIDEFGDQLYSLTVSTSPQKATTSTATTLGAVGLAVSGAPIFNDQEMPNTNLNIGVIQGFDKNGAHTGPQVYHYHLEPKSISNDDDSLIGIISDGFFIYGRKEWTTGEYPTDLDESGGHIGFTQHTGTDEGDEEYHYHIKDELYLDGYYLLFPEDYQGTPVAISH